MTTGKTNECENCSVMSNSLWPHTVHEILQARIWEWVAVSFSKGSFWPRDQTQVSCIAGRFFTVWATKKLFLGKILKCKITMIYCFTLTRLVSGGSDSKESACNAGNRGSIPESGRSPGGGNGNSSILPWRIPWTVSYSPWGRKELDTTEPLTLSLSCKDTMQNDTQ